MCKTTLIFINDTGSLTLLVSKLEIIRKSHLTTLKLQVHILTMMKRDFIELVFDTCQLGEC